MPAVTLFSKPNGEPIATTHSPGLQLGRDRRSSPTGRFLASILMTATSVRLSMPMTLAREFAAVGQLHGDFRRVLDDVRVGQDVAVGADDEARAFAARRRLRCPWPLAATWAGHAEATEEIVERDPSATRPADAPRTVSAGASRSPGR